MLLGIAGCIVLALGTFMPLISAPFVGSVNYFYNGQGDGIFILGFAAASLGFILLRKYGGLWVTALLSLALMTFTFFNLKSSLDEAARSDSSTNFSSLIQMQWGWIVLLIGVGLLIASAAMKPQRHHV